MQTRHVPMRRCVGCGTQLPKQELIHIVRSPQGSVGLDATGKVSGRGAYLCHQYACWEQSLKKNRLDYALRVQIPATERQLLLSYAQTQLERE